MRSSAKSRMAGSVSSSRTSSPFTIAPTGEMTSWHMREHRSATRSRVPGPVAKFVSKPRNGRIACACYRLTTEKFLNWQTQVDRNGLQGLRTTRIQEYRGTGRRTGLQDVRGAGPRSDVG